MAAIVTHARDEQVQPPRNPVAVDHTARLAEELASSKKPGEILRVKRISPWNYRVNYLALMAAGSDIHLNSYKINRSKFLFVNEVAGQLVIEDRTR